MEVVEVRYAAVEPIDFAGVCMSVLSSVSLVSATDPAFGHTTTSERSGAFR
jgi:hypothetical protein